MVHGYTTDPEISRQYGFAVSSIRPPLKFCNLLGSQRPFTPTVGSALFRQSDPFPLTLSDQRPLELSEGTHYRKKQLRHWRVFASEGQGFLQELDTDASLSELLHQL